MKILKKRRIQGKTDYVRRLNLLKSELPRIVFRKTNRYITSQYVTSEETQDRVEITANSKMLFKYGWPKELSGSLKSISASYLTGFLMGKKKLKEKKETPILDFGMYRVLWGGRIFAFIKGLKDAGINVKCDEEAFPKDETIHGKNLRKDFSDKFMAIKSKIEKE